MLERYTRHHKVILAVAILCITVMFALSLAIPRAKAASGITSVGFDIGWDMAASPPWSDLTQVDLFALQTTAGSGLDTHFLSSVNVPNWVAAAHAHGVMALITIGGSSDQNWQTACGDTYRSAFVANLVNYMLSNGFDGIDLDIEDDTWAAQGPPSAAMTTCIQAISSAAKAVKTKAGNTPFISADVITNWEGGWFAPSNAYIDQYNLMTYGDTCTATCASFANDVQATINQGLPKSKFVVGIDVIDGYPVAGDCGKIAAYTQQQGLAGVMTWDMNTDASHNYACFNQFASYVGDSPSTPTPLPSPTSTVVPTSTPLPTTNTPTSTPTGTPTPTSLSNTPCAVLLNGKLVSGTCTGTFSN